jgi:hypothetical protein
VENPIENDGDRRYLSIDIGTESTSIKLLHRKSAKSVIKLVDPLCGNVLRVKVPFRYNRIMCKVTGCKTIQELVKGDEVKVELKYCGWWVAGEHGGPAWKLVSLVHQESTSTESDVPTV